MGSESRPVSFRLDKHHLERLKEEAEKYGLSPGEYARRLVLDQLEQTSRRELEEGLSEVKREVSALRVDVAAAVRALLVGAGKVSKEDAHEWVMTNLKGR